MKYCPACDSHLIPQTARMSLQFFCAKCNKAYDSTPDDTLRSEINYEASETGEKYEAVENNAPFDTAAKRVAVACPGCFMPFLTHIYEGPSCISKYICGECGFKELSSKVKRG